MFGEVGPQLVDVLLGQCSTNDGLAAIKHWLMVKKPNCVLHPNGFYVALIDRSPDEEWRFHLWPKGPRTITGMPAGVHNHNCRIESRVLAGNFTNFAYDIEEIELGGFPLYEVAYQGDRYVSSATNVLRKTDKRVELFKLQSSEIAHGDSYCVERNAYHEVVVPEHTLAATLVRMSRRDSSQVYVIGLDGYPASMAFQRPCCEALTIAEKI